MTGDDTTLTVRDDGELVAQPATGFDAILVQNGVIPGREMRVLGYDPRTSEGGMTRARHTGSQIPEGRKNEWFNRPFYLVAATSWPVRATKDADGKRLETPKLLIRTVLETVEGHLIPSASSWLYESLVEIVSNHGGLAKDKPIHVRIGKAGAADKLFDCAFDEATAPLSKEALGISMPSAKKSK